MIERFDILCNRFDEFQIKLPYYAYGVAACLVSDSKIFIGGGWSEQHKNFSQSYTIDISNGQINRLSDLSLPGWTILPVYYNNGAVHIFANGEENDCFPDHMAYPINVPFN